MQKVFHSNLFFNVQRTRRAYLCQLIIGIDHVLLGDGYLHIEASTQERKAILRIVNTQAAAYALGGLETQSLANIDA